MIRGIITVFLLFGAIGAFVSYCQADGMGGHDTCETLSSGATICRDVNGTITSVE